MVDTEFQIRSLLGPPFARVQLVRDLFGIYLNMKQRTIPSFRDVRPGKNNKAIVRSQEALAQLRSEFLELALLRSMVSSLTRLIDVGHFSMHLQDECRATDVICRAYALEKASNFDAAVHYIEERMRLLISFSRGIADQLPSFTSRLENPFHEVVGAVFSSMKKANNLRFIRFLIDDCEVFNADYQKALNTLVRIPQGTPISWSVAYVQGRFDPKETLIPNQTTAREERDVVFLDRQTFGEYQKFVTGVAQLRIARLGLAQPQSDFRISEKLSRFDVNELVEASLVGTKSKKAIAFVERVSRKKEQFGGRMAYYECHLEDQRIDVKTSRGDAP